MFGQEDREKQELPGRIAGEEQGEVAYFAICLECRNLQSWISAF
jgi:hypothetical protein